MLCKKLDMLCKIRQHMNCNVFFRCEQARASGRGGPRQGVGTHKGEHEKIGQAQLACVLRRQAGGKMLAEEDGSGPCDRQSELTDEQLQDFVSGASIIMGQMGVEAHAKALAFK